jgi:hypothetical protein
MPRGGVWFLWGARIQVEGPFRSCPYVGEGAASPYFPASSMATTGSHTALA